MVIGGTKRGEAVGSLMRSNAADAGASVVACTATRLTTDCVLALLVVYQSTTAKYLATQRAWFAAWYGTRS